MLAQSVYLVLLSLSTVPEEESFYSVYKNIENGITLMVYTLTTIYSELYL